MKKIYTCKHQKDATNSCSVCEEGRENKFSSWEQAFTCDKCGEVISKGSINTLHKENEEYKEEWIEEHNCQPNSEKVKEKEEANKPHNPDSPLPSISESEVENHVIYSIECKFCSQYWNEKMPENSSEDSKKRTKEWLIKMYQEHQKSTSPRERERERERALMTLTRILMIKKKYVCFVEKI